MFNVLSQSCYQRLVLGWSLRSYAEMLRRQTTEIGGITNKYLVLVRQIVFQLGSRAAMQTAKEEVRMAGHYVYSFYLAEFPIQSLRFLQVGLH